MALRAAGRATRLVNAGNARSVFFVPCLRVQRRDLTSVPCRVSEVIDRCCVVIAWRCCHSSADQSEWLDRSSRNGCADPTSNLQIHVFHQLMTRHRVSIRLFLPSPKFLSSLRYFNLSQPTISSECSVSQWVYFSPVLGRNILCKTVDNLSVTIKFLRQFWI